MEVIGILYTSVDLPGKESLYPLVDRRSCLDFFLWRKKQFYYPVGIRNPDRSGYNPVAVPATLTRLLTG